jgi:peroxiredoxin
MKFRLLIILGMVLSLSLITGGCKEPPQIGSKHKNYTMQTAEGKQISFSDFQGKTVLMSFVADNCQGCEAQWPYIEAVSKSIGSSLIVLNVFEPTSVNKVPELVAKHNLAGFVNVIDKNNEIFSDYVIQSRPQNIIIDAKGIIKVKMPPGPFNSRDEILQLLRMAQ